MTELRLSLVGVKELRQRLERAKEALQDWDELWDRMTVLMIQVEEELWASEGATASPVWPPLAATTIAKKMRRGLPIAPMVETGRLRDSLTSPFAREVGQGRSTLGTFTESTFTWGTEVRNERGQTYAEYHQEGPHHNPRLPVRNVINVTPDLVARINRIADDWADDALREAGVS